jgi:MATE family multidrug resistance protein
VIGTALWLSGLSGLLLFLGLCTVAVPLTHAFFEPTAVGAAASNLAVTLLILLGAMELVANPGLGASGLLRGRKDTRVPMVYTLVGYWCVGVPLGLWFSVTWLEGIAGVWAGLLAGTLVTSCLMLARLANRSRLS